MNKPGGTNNTTHSHATRQAAYYESCRSLTGAAIFIPTFTVQKGYKDRESYAVWLAAQELGLTWTIAEAAIPGTIPIGTVEFCHPLSDHPIDFFPESLKRYLNRWHDFDNGGCFLEGSYFVKDLNCWKTTFETKLYPDGHYLENGNWFISEPVNMRNEWRYYVAEGDVITTGWYRGEDEEAEAPKIEFPSDFSGAADFADVDGKLELIECHAPFACGWYGEDHIDYVYWQYFAWNSTISRGTA